MNQQVTYFQNLYLPQIEQTLEDYLGQIKGQASLKKAMQYSLKAGGKRIRPLLMLASLYVLNGKIDQNSLQVAASLEMVHTYSLIHDDLPAMDNDDLRRGKPTNHKIFGEALAILAGDGLLTNAFDLILSTKLNPHLQVKLAQNLSRAAGVQGMVSGQVADMAGQGKQLSLESLKKLHNEKTGALLAYACQAGALLAGVDDNLVAKLSKFGLEFGLAFQIYDDILDVTKTTVELGKTAGKDVAEAKNTYVALLGLAGAKQELQATLSQATDVLADITLMGYDVTLLTGFLEYFEI
ncbi:polyprenyl synthetase family protein [Ligilactobacillus equi]|uniref:Farnesyl diphosphate synthase n=1 Tax=Ligilactobacillus equi DSM 15833 = JCM 10991 TaxID=1423740 RepID=A0A0R1U5T4_9LACO|nr:farnesyl diphosphate synthase [Ligilactobacillus equi]KRL85195.1 geranyltranstransferase [Ligilactobacillus equi DSM 15833 = JCM 10991]